MSKKTLVIGASETPVRYSHKAIKRLRSYGHEVVAIGKRSFEIGDVHVVNIKTTITNIHTVTMYLNPDNQEEYHDYILELQPQRIIFNPGSYSSKLAGRATAAGIEVLQDCTLVMLESGDF